MQEYYDIVSSILENEEFQKRRKYKHHGKISVYTHCVRVSKVSYYICKKLRMKDAKSVAIGALLHDFYYEPWQENTTKKSFFKKHGFTHAKEALENSKDKFPLLIDKKIENIIIRHMFPLNIIPPRYKEAWIVSVVDKLVSLEVILQPSFFISLFVKRSEK